MINKIKKHFILTLVIACIPYFIYYVTLFTNGLLDEFMPMAVTWTVILVLALCFNLILYKKISKALAKKDYGEIFFPSRRFFILAVCLSSFGIAGYLRNLRGIPENINAALALFIFIAIILVFCFLIAFQRIFIEKYISDLQNKELN